MADERDEVICELFASLKELSQLRMRYDRAVSEVSNSVIYIYIYIYYIEYLYSSLYHRDMWI